MKRLLIFCTLILATTLSLFGSEVKLTVTVSQWHHICTQATLSKQYNAILDADTIQSSIKKLIDTRLRQLTKLHWIGSRDFVRNIFVEKNIVPSNTRCYFFGDLHGDVVTLTKVLTQLIKLGELDNNWTLAQDCRLIFHGDYVDRGNWGIEVIYSLATLFVNNPDQVILIRGNHEEIDLNNSYGFSREIYSKYQHNDAQEILKSCGALYKVLSAACYLGCEQDNGMTNYLLCCHGGLEVGYNPKFLLQAQHSHAGQCLTVLPAGSIMKSLASNSEFADGFNDKLGLSERTFNNFIDREGPFLSTKIGFLWNDFTALNDQSLTYIVKGRGISLGNKLTKLLLNSGNSSQHKVRAIVRGHQHNDSMPELLKPTCKGRFRLDWSEPIDTIICTDRFNGVAGMLQVTLSSRPWNAWQYKDHFCMRNAQWQ